MKRTTRGVFGQKCKALCHSLDSLRSRPGILGFADGPEWRHPTDRHAVLHPDTQGAKARLQGVKGCFEIHTATKAARTCTITGRIWGKGICVHSHGHSRPVQLQYSKGTREANDTTAQDTDIARFHHLELGQEKIFAVLGLTSCEDPGCFFSTGPRV